MTNIAVLITCHNRKDQTLACLSRLSNQDLPPATKLEIYLVDDGCTDGTAEAVRRSYPMATILRGDGSLFWCEGMRTAWHKASETNPHYYLWLNDDTMLRPGVIATMLRIATTHFQECIVVGSCYSPENDIVTYGGLKLQGNHPGRTRLINPDAEEALSCDTFNGNCVLITRAAFSVLGVMRSFRHGVGDVDYGLMARKRKIPILLVPGFAAECRLNRTDGTWQDDQISLWRRFLLITGRKGLPPGDWWRFLWTHSGFRAFIYWPVPYLRLFIPAAKDQQY